MIKVQYIMMRVLLLFTSVITLNLYAQNSNETYKNDIEKYNILIKDSKTNITLSPKTSLFKALDAYSIARKEGNLNRQLESIKLIALGYQNQNKFNQALKYFYISRDLSNQLNDNTERVFAYNNIGYVYSLLDDTANALKYYKKSLEYKQYFTNESIFSKTYNNIAELYINKDEIENAIKYFNYSYELDKKYNLQPNLSYDLNNLGVIYYNLNKLDLALKYFKECIDSSVAIKDSSNIIFAKLNILDIEIKEYKNFSKSIFNDLEYTKKYIFKNHIIDLYEPTYKLLIFYYKNIGDYKKALDVSDEFFVYNDSLNKLNNIESLYNIKYKYEAKQKENENKLLKQSIKLQEIKSNKQQIFRIFLITLVGLLIILFIIIYLKVKYKIKSNKEFEAKAIEIEKINEAYKTLNENLEQKISESNEELKNKIEKLKKAESEQLILLSNYKEANNIKEEFLNNISNEIRTPLNSINGLTDMLNLKLPEGNCNNIAAFSNGIKQSVSQLLYIFNNFIDHAKINFDDLNIVFVSIDLSDIVKKIVDIYQFRMNEKNIQLNLNLEANEKAIADKKLISKIITDIIDNAIKFTENGEITILTQLVNNDKEILLKISDTGVGIDNNTLLHIFDDIESSNINKNIYEGAGLGLKVVKKYIDLMNGRIEISSKLGKGTSINIYLSTDKQFEKNKGVSVNVKTLVTNKELKNHDFQILIVEDDKFNQLFLGALIGEIASIEIVSNADDVIKLIKKRQEEDLGFDLILMDINLPGKWDGITLMKEIKKLWVDYEKVVFIAQTAYTDTFDRDRIKEAGFNDYIAKPIDTVELINKIKIHLLS